MVANPVFSTSQREDHRLFGRLFSHLGVVVASGFGSITAADQIEPLNVTRFDCGNNFISETEDHAVMEPNRRFADEVLGERLASHGLGDDLREVVGLEPCTARHSGDAGRKESVGVNI